jgi:hypothetical protein
VVGTVQFLSPVEAEVAELMVLTTLLPLSSSILTYPDSPVDDQVMAWELPLAQDSLPLGDVTVIDREDVVVGGGVLAEIVKLALLVSDTLLLEALVTLIRA